MATITLTEQEAKEIGYDLPEVIDERGGKHDCTDKKILFERDGKFYTMWLSYSYEDGLQLWGDVTATEVKKVEKVVEVWEPV